MTHVPPPATPDEPVFGTPLSTCATRLMLLGAGELGKEVAIEAQRLGVEVIAVDRYADAPAMQVAHRHHVLDMFDGDALESVIRRERPHYILPEVEAIATQRLVELEAQGWRIAPSARAARLTMDREGIRRLAAEELGLATSRYEFAGTDAECLAAIARIGTPCVVKPVMSSSGKGQLVVRNDADAAIAWQTAVGGARAAVPRVIVEALVEFDYEITLLTVRHVGGTAFCAPIGHLQIDGDYRESWQPQAMSPRARERAEAMAEQVTRALGGRGIFGVEFFVRGDEVIFSEVSPRPHDTGMVTLIGQDLSEFALHVRAVLGLPVPAILRDAPAASVAILGSGHGRRIRYHGVPAALAEPGTALRLFGKPEIQGKRRLAVALARDTDVELARAKARRVAAAITIDVEAQEGAPDTFPGPGHEGTSRSRT
ncbi:MAG: formate-dependent phosphoribosylglycinamide formyltransferase [Gammaproteobacteria bacterium]|nr:formate-dependent phosphoribosylglycinamide formyltransferase [Gammaproteobacteria bacterium]